MAAPSRATVLLNRLSGGDAAASQELMDLVYEELRALARAHMARERADHTLQPTALVHEAFLRLVDPPGASWPSRGHFYAMASRVMRSLLVDHARAKRAKKRGGEGVRLALEEGTPPPDERGEERGIDVLDLNAALEELARVDGELARVVELRFFGGLTVAETARVAGLPVRTLERRLRVANAWLRERLDGA